jgi:multidrug transporter EmrE-like cation transporter
MTKTTFLLILSSVALSALAQIALKAGMATSVIQANLASPPGIAALTAIFGSWRILLGLLIYFLSAGVWLFVLARVDVSLAYPFVGLGFILTMLLGWGMRGEILSVHRVAGTALIVAGVVLLARSA